MVDDVVIIRWSRDMELLHFEICKKFLYDRSCGANIPGGQFGPAHGVPKARHKPLILILEVAFAGRLNHAERFAGINNLLRVRVVFLDRLRVPRVALDGREARFKKLLLLLARYLFQEYRRSADFEEMARQYRQFFRVKCAHRADDVEMPSAAKRVAVKNANRCQHLAVKIFQAKFFEPDAIRRLAEIIKTIAVGLQGVLLKHVAECPAVVIGDGSHPIAKSFHDGLLKAGAAVEEFGNEVVSMKHVMNLTKYDYKFIIKLVIKFIIKYMASIPQTVSVTELRTKTRAVIQKAMASDEPIYIAYNSKLPVCLVRTDAVRIRPAHNAAGNERLRRFAGHLKDEKTFSEGAMEYQKRIRDEWEIEPPQRFGRLKTYHLGVRGELTRKQIYDAV